MRLVVAFALAVTATVALAAEPPANFAAHFVDTTMRVDFTHMGNAAEEVIALDRVWAEGIWAGSRSNLVDPFGGGRYRAKVFDPATGALLFSRGFDSYFGEYRTTPAAAKGERRCYHESVLVPFPKHKVRFSIEVHSSGRAPVTLASFDIDPGSWEVLRAPLQEGAVVVDAWHSGDPHAKVDVVIVGEGYSRAEEGKFRADLERFARIFLAAEPYRTLRDRFNIRGVLSYSQDSGISEPSYGSVKRSAVGATFDSLGTERYVLTEDNRALRDVAAHVPYDTICIMVNSARYGGGGIYNLFSTFTTDDQWHAYIFLHEFGHSFGGLADEYYTSLVAYNEFYPKGTEPNEANITALLDPVALKWRALVTPGTPIPTPWEKAGFDEMDTAYQKVRQELNERIARLKREGAPRQEIEKLQGESDRRSREHQDRVDSYFAKSKYVGQVGAFEGAGYSAQGLYRPMLDCLMFSKGAKPLCRVCQAAVTRVIEHFTE